MLSARSVFWRFVPDRDPETMPSHPALSVVARSTETEDPFAIQLALSRVHARLVPMRRGATGYELDPSTQAWFELPAGRGFAGYGLGRAMRMLLDVLRGLTALHDTFGASGESFAHGEVALPQLRVDADGVCRLVPLSARHASGLETELAPENLGHLAPERLLGEKLDARADVFSAGVLLWEALAGRRLFEELTADAIIDRVMGEKLQMPQLPPELAWAIPLKSIAARALAVDPYQRFADCAELATAIAIVARDRVASHSEIANFFGAKPRSASSSSLSARQRPVPTRSSTFPAVGSPVTATSSRSSSTLAALGRATRSAPHKSPFSALLSAEARGPVEAAPSAASTLRRTTLTSLGTPESVREVPETAPISSKAPPSSRRPPPLPAWAQVANAPVSSAQPSTFSVVVAATVAAPPEAELEHVAFRGSRSRRLWGLAALLSLGAILATAASLSQSSALPPASASPSLATPLIAQSGPDTVSAQQPATSQPAGKLLLEGPSPARPAAQEPRPAPTQVVVPVQRSGKAAPGAKSSNSSAKDYGI